MKSGLFFIVVLLLGACTEQNDPMAAFDQGDFDTSFRLWKQQAEAGDAYAQNYLGIHYYLGLGVPRNFSKALAWYERAAIAGDINAQHNLGLMYESGQGVERDFEKAFVWLYAAHRQGNKNADAALDTLMYKLSPNNKMQLRKVARNYIINEVLGPNDDDY
jgi:TPR repeat protein